MWTVTLLPGFQLPGTLVGDVDEDGTLDLICSHGPSSAGQNTLEILLGVGFPQFDPGFRFPEEITFVLDVRDFDGDGHRNIWTSVPDTLASIANFLVKKGWQRDRDWGFEVTIPQAVSCAQEGPDLAKPLSHWASLGISRISGKGFPPGELKAQAMMLVPAGRDGPEFIVTPNFYIIKEYNNSDLYALYIGNLADRIAFGTGASSPARKNGNRCSNA